MLTLEIVYLIVDPNANYEIESNITAAQRCTASEILSKISF